jgi:hypothetical protein
MTETTRESIFHMFKSAVPTSTIGHACREYGSVIRCRAWPPARYMTSPALTGLSKTIQESKTVHSSMFPMLKSVITVRITSLE